MASAKFRLLASTAAGLILASAAFATGAQAAAAAATSNDPTALAEVVVTATRREESLQKVPVAVTAITADQLTKIHVTTIEDLQYSVPNLVFGGESTARRPDIALRGVDSGTRVPGFEGSIGFFVDGIYQPFPAQWNNPILDIDRLEVLYGPQDTLFGKNTVAGAISITTKKPTNKFSVDATAEYGNYNYYLARLTVNVPIIDDKLFARATAFIDRRDGYVTNVYDGKKLDGLDQQGARLALRFEPDSHLSINFSADMYEDFSGELQSQTIGGLYSTGNPRTVNLNTDPETSRYLYNVGLSADYTTTSGAKFSSITGWSTVRAHYHMDEDGNPANLWQTDIFDKANDFSQEFRFTSPKSDKFDYLGGVYFLYSYWAQPGGIQILPGDPDSTPGGLGFLTPSGAISTADATGKRVTSLSYAGYINGNYHFNDKLTLSLGGRISHDDKALDYPGQPNFGGNFLNLCKLGASLHIGCILPNGAYPTLPAYADNLGETGYTGSASLSYQATPDALIYAKIGNGFKAGGWNSDLSHTSPPDRFAPEHVINYEIGAKTEFFDHHLRINGDIFYEEYQNKQETIFVSILEGFHITNAASASIKGVEISSTLALGDFTFNASGGYIDPTYNNFQCSATVNCRGQQLVFATRTTAQASIDYRHAIGDLGVLALRLDTSWRDKMYFTVPNTNAASINGYALLNARASFTLPNHNTEIYVFAKNLTDETYKISQVPGDPASPGFGATSSVLYGQPRMFAVGITQHF